MFDKIAGRYDMINTAITAGLHNTWRRRMVESLELKPGHTVLDAGTGTADVAIALAKHLRKSGGELSTDSVVGVDPSQGMLAIGRSVQILHHPATRMFRADFHSQVVTDSCLLLPTCSVHDTPLGPAQEEGGQGGVLGQGSAPGARGRTGPRREPPARRALRRCACPFRPAVRACESWRFLARQCPPESVSVRHSALPPGHDGVCDSQRARPRRGAPLDRGALEGRCASCHLGAIPAVLPACPMGHQVRAPAPASPARQNLTRRGARARQTRRAAAWRGTQWGRAARVPLSGAEPRQI